MQVLNKPIVAVAAILALLGAVQAYAVQGNAAEGEKLYKDSCAPCHTEHPAKMVGKPAEGLLAKMNKVKTMDGATGKVMTMQNTLKALSDQQLLNIATYLHTMN